jgi:hypothetical protein
MQTRTLYAVIACVCAGCSANAPEENTTTTTSAEQRCISFGNAQTFTPSGTIDTSNPFFQELGTNGRACVSCHDASAGWSINTSFNWRLFWATDGMAPLFRPHDGAVRPDADVSDVWARRSAYALLLNKSLVRFTRVPAATWEFDVVDVDDPYGWSTTTAFSNFRRVLSISNVNRHSSFNWTGDPGDPKTKLMASMNNATKNHAQRTTDVPPDQQAAGADFMLSLSFAQIRDPQAGRLDAAGARGGAYLLSQEPFYVGINSLGGDPVSGLPFDPQSMTLYSAWERFSESSDDARERARASIAHGEELFYKFEFDITDVPGLNDALGRTVIRGTCTTCHNAPNNGGHSEFRLMDTGVADAARWKQNVPLLTLRNKATGEQKQTTDLGRATISGKWSDIGKFKTPVLRGLASRAPYFHDGSAASLQDVLDFYEQRFGAHLGGSDRRDLIRFLNAL